MFIATSSHIREYSYDILANCLRLIEVFVLKVRNWVELINDKNLLFSSHTQFVVYNILMIDKTSNSTTFSRVTKRAQTCR